METRVTATEAARSLSDILNRVQYCGESFLVERNGQPACRIVPAQPRTRTARELASLMRAAPKPDAGFAADVASVLTSQPPAPGSPWER